MSETPHPTDVEVTRSLAAQLSDRAGKVLARVEHRDGRWAGKRVGAPLTGGYIPSA